MLYTRKGDTGTTSAFNCNQRFSKSTALAEALGTVDELNSYIGLCKVRIKEETLVDKYDIKNLLEEVQQNLFIVQAEIAGSDKHIAYEKVKVMEEVISRIEENLPPIHSFFISGGTESSALLDLARTIARRAERRVVAFYMKDDSTVMSYGKDSTVSVSEIHETALVYLNRLSSFLYALARLANHVSGTKEKTPRY